MIRMVFVYLYTGTLVKFLKKYCWLTNIKWHGDRRPTAWTAHDQLVECWQVDYTQLLSLVAYPQTPVHVLSMPSAHSKH